MKRIILLNLILLLLVACAPKESPASESAISDIVRDVFGSSLTTPEDMPDLDYEMSDEVTRPIPPSVDVVDIEKQYHQRVLDTIYACFRSFVNETDDPNEFISHKGTRIRLVDQDRLMNSKRLSDADKANGIVWEGMTGINTIYFDESTGRWEDRRLLRHTFQYYENGRLTRWTTSGFVDFQCRADRIP